jgi:phosphoglycolate phosphatase
MKRIIDAGLLIFDLDGTLIDSSEDIAWSVNKTLVKLGMKELPYKEVLGYIGWGVRMLLEQAVPLDKHHMLDDARRIFLEFYSGHMLVNTMPYPEVIETLEYLHQMKKKMAVVTNKPYILTKGILEGLAIDGFFIMTLGGDSVRNKKPHPEAVETVLEGLAVPPSKTVFIGDSRIDIETGKCAGILTIGAVYGFRGRKELEEAGANMIINSFGELKEIIR